MFSNPYRYIARPLLIKGRKFDIRVHWLVAWTKPYLVFYNHNASVVRLSLNLYREFDFDRATHLTNLVKKILIYLFHLSFLFYSQYKKIIIVMLLRMKQQE